jgi:hypothetical protein
VYVELCDTCHAEFSRSILDGPAIRLRITLWTDTKGRGEPLVKGNLSRETSIGSFCSRTCMNVWLDSLKIQDDYATN